MRGIERWRQQQPDRDNPEDDGVDDRYAQVGTTFGGAAVIRGNLTPECATAVRAVLESLGKKAGSEDDRPAAHCDVHHIRHQADGGETSIGNCLFLCQFNHDVGIHRLGWRIVLQPDGSTMAYGPRDQVRQSQALHGQAAHGQPPPATRPG